MAVLSVVLIILFVIVSLILIFLVAIQSEDNTGLGGVFGGNSDSVFGGQTNKVLNRITAYVLVAFFVFSVVIGIINKTSEGSILSIAADSSSSEVVSAETVSSDAVSAETVPEAAESN